jgi:hypothetical protein
MSCEKYGVRLPDEADDDFDEVLWLSLIANIPYEEAEEHVANHRLLHTHDKPVPPTEDEPEALPMAEERPAIEASPEDIDEYFWNQRNEQKHRDGFWEGR